MNGTPFRLAAQARVVACWLSLYTKKSMTCHHTCSTHARSAEVCMHAVLDYVPSFQTASHGPAAQPALELSDFQIICSDLGAHNTTGLPYSLTLHGARGVACLHVSFTHSMCGQGPPCQPATDLGLAAVGLHTAAWHRLCSEASLLQCIHCHPGRMPGYSRLQLPAAGTLVQSCVGLAV